MKKTINHCVENHSENTGNSTSEACKAELEVTALSAKNSRHAGYIAAIIRLEKRTFPASEALDINYELKKWNCVLRCIRLAEQVVGYSLCVHIKRATQLHKLCVAKNWQRQRLGQKLMEDLIDTERSRGAAEISLWVDPARLPAMALYSKCGFLEVSSVEDYYGPGRQGIKMKKEL
jgi:ribosomal protein S18 acetylase RimI-like enzyme